MSGSASLDPTPLLILTRGDFRRVLDESPKVEREVRLLPRLLPDPEATFRHRATADAPAELDAADVAFAAVTDPREMADVAKVITVIASSPTSFAEAAQSAVTEAAKTIHGITGADVVSMSCVVQGDQIIEYRTTVNIAFGVER